MGARFSIILVDSGCVGEKILPCGREGPVNSNRSPLTLKLKTVKTCRYLFILLFKGLGSIGGEGAMLKSDTYHLLLQTHSVGGRGISQQ